MDQTVLLRSAIIRSFTGNSNIMGMTFQYASIGDAHKLGMMQVVDGGGTTIAHALA